MKKTNIFLVLLPALMLAGCNKKDGINKNDDPKPEEPIIKAYSNEVALADFKTQLTAAIEANGILTHDEGAKFSYKLVRSDEYNATEQLLVDGNVHSEKKSGDAGKDSISYDSVNNRASSEGYRGQFISDLSSFEEEKYSWKYQDQVEEDKVFEYNLLTKEYCEIGDELVPATEYVRASYMKYTEEILGFIASALDLKDEKVYVDENAFTVVLQDKTEEGEGSKYIVKDVAQIIISDSKVSFALSQELTDEDGTTRCVGSSNSYFSIEKQDVTLAACTRDGFIEELE